MKEHHFPYKWYIATITGKYRDRDHEKNEDVVTAHGGIDYGFERSMEAGRENYERSLHLKIGNKAVKFGRTRKRSLLDIRSWFE